MVAAGFLRSNVKDLLRYLEVFRCGGTVGGRRILSEASVARMTTPYFQWGPTQFYGYGLNVQANYHGVSIIEHGGGLKGISAQVSDDILCRFLTNARGEVYAVFCGLRVIRRVKEEGTQHDPQPS